MSRRADGWGMPVSPSADRSMSGTPESNRSLRDGIPACRLQHLSRMAGNVVGGLSSPALCDLREHRLAGSLIATFAGLSRHLSAPSGYVLLADQPQRSAA